MTFSILCNIRTSDDHTNFWAKLEKQVHIMDPPVDMKCDKAHADDTEKSVQKLKDVAHE